MFDRRLFMKIYFEKEIGVLSNSEPSGWEKEEFGHKKCWDVSRDTQGYLLRSYLHPQSSVSDFFAKTRRQVQSEKRDNKKRWGDYWSQKMQLGTEEGQTIEKSVNLVTQDQGIDKSSNHELALHEKLKAIIKLYIIN